ncbi:metalloregulator ArsR/SmtB family transcription factor [Aciduricibacillus chroicocephali]|uniref:Metalloregulator ArsR/SmtB family transcription factor n=1 Tax=Aciduricibacillus chroicocephali TaxID=3054939 RepID=A0ABY9L058_9BACI|nr:metalloregulator ArsR/SmtB family transcription factor [Bacillaceae bacterium 44XB]
MVTYEETGIFLKTIGEETRLKIVCYLARDSFCVCEIVQLLGMSQPSVSQHLRKLKAAKIITEEKRGRWTFHSLNTDHPQYSLLLQLLDTLPSVMTEIESLTRNGRRILCD